MNERGVLLTLVILGTVVAGTFSCGPGASIEPLRKPEITILGTDDQEHFNLPTSPTLPRIDLNARYMGPLVYGVVDATQWRDSILVLDRYGLVWVTGPGMGPVRRVFSLPQAAGRPIKKPLSILATDTGFGTWDVAGAVLYWVPADRDTVLHRGFGLEGSGLFLASVVPLEPPRMHGRLATGDGGTFLMELRDDAMQSVGASVHAALVRITGTQSDTLLEFMAPSQAIRQGTIWVCCRRSPLFSPQPWWALLTGYRLAFADGIRRQVVILSNQGKPLRKVTWEPTKRDRRFRRREIVAYRLQDVHRTFPFASGQELRSMEKQAERKHDLVPGATSTVVPSLTQLVADDQGRIWVRRFDRSKWPEGLSTTWDLFTSDLIYLGTVSLPMVDYVFEIRKGNILGTRVAYGGLHYVVVVPLLANE